METDTLPKNKKISAVIKHFRGDYAHYTGDYSITPKFDSEVTLSTANKVMREDVTVHKVPRYDISNEAGGITIYLGTEGEENGS